MTLVHGIQMHNTLDRVGDKDEEFSPIAGSRDGQSWKTTGFHQVLQKHALTLQPLSLGTLSGQYYKDVQPRPAAIVMWMPLPAN